MRMVGWAIHVVMATMVAWGLGLTITSGDWSNWGVGTLVMLLAWPLLWAAAMDAMDKRGKP